MERNKITSLITFNIVTLREVRQRTQENYINKTLVKESKTIKGRDKDLG